jgi:hypothetical protein
MGNKNNDLGIKTAVSAREARILRALAAGQRVIEVGSLLGYSTIQLARTARHVDAIDPHNGYPYFNPVPTLPCFLANLQRWSVDARVTPRVGLAQDWLPKLKGGFTFVDCTGFYEDTRYCLEHAGSPVIGVHDFGRRGCDGVAKAVLEFVRNNNKQLSVVDTLAIITT